MDVIYGYINRDNAHEKIPIHVPGCIIGSDSKSCNYVIEHQNVAPKHCIISSHSYPAIIQPLTIGAVIKVNDENVSMNGVKLKEGDSILVGDTKIQWEYSNKSRKSRRSEILKTGGSRKSKKISPPPSFRNNARLSLTPNRNKNVMLSNSNTTPLSANRRSRCVVNLGGGKMSLPKIVNSPRMSTVAREFNKLALNSVYSPSDSVCTMADLDQTNMIPNETCLSPCNDTTLATGYTSDNTNTSSLSTKIEKAMPMTPNYKRLRSTPTSSDTSTVRKLRKSRCILNLSEKLSIPKIVRTPKLSPEKKKSMRKSEAKKFQFSPTDDKVSIVGSKENNVTCAPPQNTPSSAARKNLEDETNSFDLSMQVNLPNSIKCRRMDDLESPGSPLCGNANEEDRNEHSIASMSAEHYYSPISDLEDELLLPAESSDISTTVDGDSDITKQNEEYASPAFVSKSISTPEFKLSNRTLKFVTMRRRLPSAKKMMKFGSPTPFKKATKIPVHFVGSERDKSLCRELQTTTEFNGPENRANRVKYISSSMLIRESTENEDTLKNDYGDESNRDSIAHDLCSEDTLNILNEHGIGIIDGPTQHNQTDAEMTTADLLDNHRHSSTLDTVEEESVDLEQTAENSEIIDVEKTLEFVLPNLDLEGTACDRNPIFVGLDTVEEEESADMEAIMSSRDEPEGQGVAADLDPLENSKELATDLDGSRSDNEIESGTVEVTGMDLDPSASSTKFVSDPVEETGMDLNPSESSTKFVSDFVEETGLDLDPSVSESSDKEIVILSLDRTPLKVIEEEDLEYKLVAEEKSEIKIDLPIDKESDVLFKTPESVPIKMDLPNDKKTDDFFKTPESVPPRRKNLLPSTELITTSDCSDPTTAHIFSTDSSANEKLYPRKVKFFDSLLRTPEVSFTEDVAVFDQTSNSNTSSLGSINLDGNFELSDTENSEEYCKKFSKSLLEQIQIVAEKIDFKENLTSKQGLDDFNKFPISNNSLSEKMVQNSPNLINQKTSSNSSDTDSFTLAIENSESIVAPLESIPNNNSSPEKLVSNSPNRKTSSNCSDTENFSLVIENFDDLDSLLSDSPSHIQDQFEKNKENPDQPENYSNEATILTAAESNLAIQDFPIENSTSTNYGFLLSSPAPPVSLNGSMEHVFKIPHPVNKIRNPNLISKLRISDMECRQTRILEDVKEAVDEKIDLSSKSEAVLKFSEVSSPVRVSIGNVNLNGSIDSHVEDMFKTPKKHSSKTLISKLGIAEFSNLCIKSSSISSNWDLQKEIENNMIIDQELESPSDNVESVINNEPDTSIKNMILDQEQKSPSEVLKNNAEPAINNEIDSTIENMILEQEQGGPSEVLKNNTESAINNGPDTAIEYMILDEEQESPSELLKNNAESVINNKPDVVKNIIDEEPTTSNQESNVAESVIAHEEEEVQDDLELLEKKPVVLTKIAPAPAPEIPKKVVPRKTKKFENLETVDELLPPQLQPTLRLTRAAAKRAKNVQEERLEDVDAGKSKTAKKVPLAESAVDGVEGKSVGEEMTTVVPIQKLDGKTKELIPDGCGTAGTSSLVQEIPAKSIPKRKRKLTTKSQQLELIEVVEPEKSDVKNSENSGTMKTRNRRVAQKVEALEATSSGITSSSSDDQKSRRKAKISKDALNLDPEKSDVKNSKNLELKKTRSRSKVQKVDTLEAISSGTVSSSDDQKPRRKAKTSEGATSNNDAPSWNRLVIKLNKITEEEDDVKSRVTRVRFNSNPRVRMISPRSSENEKLTKPAVKGARKSSGKVPKSSSKTSRKSAVQETTGSKTSSSEEPTKISSQARKNASKVPRKNAKKRRSQDATTDETSVASGSNSNIARRSTRIRKIINPYNIEPNIKPTSRKSTKRKE